MKQHTARIIFVVAGALIIGLAIGNPFAATGVFLVAYGIIPE